MLPVQYQASISLHQRNLRIINVLKCFK
ncbi:hypothetical protein M513_11607 [Trichuris suis]|uniref:Uncharacterized protein n=1 Tax=Trichuris suis TaxID=68888 RepID=A0A085LRB7_9BILA|nr:hypothetical protein M513_11607 [Trichuris suis]